MKLPWITLLAAALALPAAAQSMKPGLWEVTNNMASADGEMQAAFAEMQKEMAAMEPEERKAMEQMLAKQGVQLSGGGMGARMCLTPEMAKRSDLMVQQQGDCTYNRSRASGGKMKFSFSCSNPKSRGEGEVSFSGDTSYTMKMKVVSAVAGGKDEVMTMDAGGKWIGADCGSVKPFVMPKAK